MKLSRAQVQLLAEQTSDAYSADRYASWFACANLLLNKFGYSLREAEAILRSKWMRWAADSHEARYGKVPARAIEQFLNEMVPMVRTREVAELVAGTFADAEAR